MESFNILLIFFIFIIEGVLFFFYENLIQKWIKKENKSFYFLPFKVFIFCFFLLYFSFGINTLYAKNTQKIVKSFLSEGVTIKVYEVLKNQGVIWGFDFLPNNQILYTERKGKIKIFDLNSDQIYNLSNVPKVAARGQGGLLDIRLHPNYKQNQWIYITYSVSKKNQYSTRLSRFKLKDYAVSDLEVLFTAFPFSSRTLHFGSRIAFDSKGYVFITVGDRGKRNEAQNLENHNGTVIRLHDNGQIPSDNPFVQDKNYKHEIWSYGHRNSQGLVFDLSQNQLWLHEHGPRGGDEINLIQKGKNYGWPKASYGLEYFSRLRVGKPFLKGTVQPVKYYTPSIAPSGFEIYSGKLFSQWKGDFFLGALKLTHLNRVVIQKQKAKAEERLLSDLYERVRNVREDSKGFLYFSTDSGKIFKLSLYSFDPH